MNSLFKISAVTLALAGAGLAAPWLGVTFKKAQYENHLALAVKGVHPNSGCFSVGIVAGDTIIGLNGKKLESVAQLQELVSKGKAGQKMSVEYIHEGKRLTKDAKLTERTSTRTGKKDRPNPRPHCWTSGLRGVVRAARRFRC